MMLLNVALRAAGVRPHLHCWHCDRRHCLL